MSSRRRAPALYLLIALLSFFFVASAAHAATSAPGVNLRWDQCYGDNGAWNKNFACDTNSGVERLVGSFELSEPLADVAGFEAFVDITSASPALPAWWQFKNFGTCRTTSLTMSSTPPANSAACVDWALGQAASGIGAYVTGLPPDRAKIVMAAAVPQSALAQWVAGQEYFAFSIQINHAKTVGTGPCAGCLEPVCLFFSGLRVPGGTFVPGSGDSRIRLTQGANYLGSQYVTWQHGYPLNVVTGVCGGMTGGGLFCQYMQANFSCVLADPTSQRRSTWGEVKSLYR